MNPTSSINRRALEADRLIIGRLSLFVLIVAIICATMIALPTKVESIATINIYKHRYPFYGGYGYGYPIYGGYAGGYGGGIHLGYGR